MNQCEWVPSAPARVAFKVHALEFCACTRFKQREEHRTQIASSNSISKCFCKHGSIASLPNFTRSRDFFSTCIREIRKFRKTIGQNKKIDSSIGARRQHHPSCDASSCGGKQQLAIQSNATCRSPKLNINSKRQLLAVIEPMPSKSE